eukprot:4452595-Prymnesium_polylepis.2
MRQTTQRTSHHLATLPRNRDNGSQRTDLRAAISATLAASPSLPAVPELTKSTSLYMLGPRGPGANVIQSTPATTGGVHPPHAAPGHNPTRQLPILVPRERGVLIKTRASPAMALSRRWIWRLQTSQPR